MRFFVDPVQAPLRANRDERNAVRVRICSSQEKIDRSRSEGCNADTRPIGQTAVDVGHERCSLLVTDKNETDRRIVQSVDDVYVLLARYAKGVLDILILQALNKKLSGSR